MTFAVMDSLMKNVFTWTSLIPSDHFFPTSFYEFKDDIIFNSTIEKVYLDLTDYKATVTLLDWKNSTSKLLTNATNFQFDFISPTTLESKLETIVGNLTLNNKFQWDIGYQTSDPKGFFDFLTFDIIIYFVFLGFMHYFNGIGSIVGTDFMNVESSVAVRFKDVAGLDEARGEIEEIVDILKNPTKYHDMGAKIPKGILMSGPSGTGKTLLAKAIAGEAGCSFISLSGSSFNEIYVGVGSSRVRKLFQQARSSAPCIIFIDEIDALGHRGKSNSEGDTTLNQLLVEMDGFPSEVVGRDSVVIVMAATNRPQLIDSALKRPGRFDRHITVSLPDKYGRKDIFKVHLKKINLAEKVLSLKEIEMEKKRLKEIKLKIIEGNGDKKPNLEKLKNDVAKEMLLNSNNEDSDFETTEEHLTSLLTFSTVSPNPSDNLVMQYADKLCEITAGFSGADIKNICNEAAILACRNKEASVNLKHFDLAIERVIAGLAKTKNNISPKEKEILAHHEAGHAVIAYFVRHSDPLVKVSIVPRSGVSEDGSGGQTLGFAQYSPQDKYLMSKEQILDKMMVAMGGRTAEKLFFNSITSGAQDDLQKVTKLAYWQIQELGMNDSIGWLSFPQQQQKNPFSEETCAMIDKEVRELVLKVQKLTMDLMIVHKESVLKVAMHLLEKEVLIYEDMIRLLGPRPFDDDEKSTVKEND
ncbi:hypothetical protein HDU92_003015 [Lobulomyces angularis]|nr:hypothetical protein HDU92_003015 [Lobulomyces angularis]